MVSIQVVDMSLPPTALPRARLALGTISFDQGYINVPESFLAIFTRLNALTILSFVPYTFGNYCNALRVAFGLDCG